jgi:hypothetical protein
MRTNYIANYSGMLTGLDEVQTILLAIAGGSKGIAIGGPAGVGKSTLSRYACEVLNVTPITKDASQRQDTFTYHGYPVLKANGKVKSGFASGLLAQARENGKPLIVDDGDLIIPENQKAIFNNIVNPTLTRDDGYIIKEPRGSKFFLFFTYNPKESRSVLDPTFADRVVHLGLPYHSEHLRTAVNLMQRSTKLDDVLVSTYLGSMFEKRAVNVGKGGKLNFLQKEKDRWTDMLTGENPTLVGKMTQYLFYRGDSKPAKRPRVFTAQTLSTQEIAEMAKTLSRYSETIRDVVTGKKKLEKKEINSGDLDEFKKHWEGRDLQRAEIHSLSAYLAARNCGADPDLSKRFALEVIINGLGYHNGDKTVNKTNDLTYKQLLAHIAEYEGILEIR